MRSIVLSALVLALATGCTTERYVTDARHPEVAITEDGSVTFRGRFVEVEDLPGLLKRSGFTKQDTINIHVPEDLRDYRAPRCVMAILAREGFSRPILLSDRKAYSEVGLTADERRRARRQQQREQMKLPPEKRTVRYK